MPKQGVYLSGPSGRRDSDVKSSQSPIPSDGNLQGTSLKGQDTKQAPSSIAISIISGPYLTLTSQERYSHLVALLLGALLEWQGETPGSPSLEVSYSIQGPEFQLFRRSIL